MAKIGNQKIETGKMVGMAIFSAIIIVLQLTATFVKIGSFSITLVLIPIVVGAAVYGPKSGAWFGGVFGFIVLLGCIFGWDVGGNILWNANPFLTIGICFIKGIAAGYAAGIVYTAIAKKYPYLGVIAAAILCPVVNTGLFCLAMALFFHDILVDWAAGTELLYFTIIGLVGVNFLIELAINLILCPTVALIIRTGKKIKGRSL